MLPKASPSYRKFGTLDPNFLMDEAHFIMKNLPCSEADDYTRIWRFHKSSELDIIRECLAHIEKHAKTFDTVFRRQARPEFFIFTETLKDREEVVWYKDKVSKGQFHFAISGGSNIAIDNGKTIKTVKMDDGVCWYLNSIDYMHRINDMHGAERLELYAPVNQQPMYIEEKMQLVVDNKWKYLKEETK